VCCGGGGGEETRKLGLMLATLLFNPISFVKQSCQYHWSGQNKKQGSFLPPYYIIKLGLCIPSENQIGKKSPLTNEIIFIK